MAHALSVECAQNVHSAGQRAYAYGACATIGQGGYSHLLHRLHYQKVGIGQCCAFWQRYVEAVARQHGFAAYAFVAAA